MTVSAVLPALARVDPVYLGLSNAEYYGDFSLGERAKRQKSFYNSYRIFIKNCVRPFRPIARSSLLVAVFHVIIMGAKKKMVGVHANLIITKMKGKKAIWYRASENLIRQPVRLFGFVEKIKRAVARGADGGCPFPAAVIAALVHFFHEADFYVFHPSMVPKYLAGGNVL